MNRLHTEQSPYLLQHKDNPVHWQPWDEQALEQARKENKPIFLSIGYSTCHWCHVMEHESFEDQEIADLLNQHYVAIKVDREERPDLDDVYMKAVQQMTGHGGWPMSVWLTPDRKAFFGGTYFPKENFIKLLTRIHEVWIAQEGNLRSDADRVHDVVEQVTRLPQAESDHPLTDRVLLNYVRDAEKLFEPVYGGFGRAPKFPQAMMLSTLMRISRRLSNPTPEEWIVKTLDGMHRGGMYDHLAGGFHRYATDDEWLVPHFEKMLYDNALLAFTFCEAFQYFGDLEYSRVARETLDYVLSEMTHPQGGFYSAQDADSLNPERGHKEEGYFATFSFKELEANLTSEELERMTNLYSLCPEGHYEGRNILHLSAGRSREEKQDQLVASALSKLRSLRAARPAPHLDDKIITEWNGLMISAFAKGYQTLGDERYLEAAQKALRFCLDHLRSNDGSLWRRWRKGEAGITAYADDYSALIAALLHTYECDFNEEWLSCARDLQAKLDAVYWDEKNKGYFRDAGSDPTLVTRIKDDYDGVTPTANSLSALNLLRLYSLTLDDAYRARAEDIFGLYQPILEKAALSLSQMMMALDFSLDDSKEIAIVYDELNESSARELRSLLKAVRVPFFPNQVVACAQAGKSSVAILQDRPTLKGHPTAYVCVGQTCQKPETEPRFVERMAGQIKALT